MNNTNFISLRGILNLLRSHKKLTKLRLIWLNIVKNIIKSLSKEDKEYIYKIRKE